MQNYTRDLCNLFYCRDKYIRINLLPIFECWAELNFCNCTEITDVWENMEGTVTLYCHFWLKHTSEAAIADRTLILQSVCIWAQRWYPVERWGFLLQCKLISSLNVIKESITKCYVKLQQVIIKKVPVMRSRKRHIFNWIFSSLFLFHGTTEERNFSSVLFC